jgi:hypothetical protein
MEIKDIKLVSFLANPSSAHLLAISSSPELRRCEDLISIGDLTEQSWEFIKDVQNDLESGELTIFKQFEYLRKIIGEKKMSKLYLFETIITCNYITEQIQEILTVENQLLGGNGPSIEEEAAGIANYANLGTYLQTRTLANNDVTKIDAVNKIKYANCLLELYTRKVDSDFERELRKIYNNKSK